MLSPSADGYKRLWQWVVCERAPKLLEKHNLVTSMHMLTRNLAVKDIDKWRTTRYNTYWQAVMLYEVQLKSIGS